MAHPQPSEKRDFFVSFNSADREWAEWIAFELKSHGYSVFFQHWDFGPGCNFAVEMHQAAEQSERTIAVLSPTFLTSEFCQAEWIAAFIDDPTGTQRKLVPVRVKSCKPGGMLKGRVYVELIGAAEEEARKRLLEGVSLESRVASGVIFPGTESKRFPGALPAGISARAIRTTSIATTSSRGCMTPCVLVTLRR